MAVDPTGNSRVWKIVIDGIADAFLFCVSRHRPHPLPLHRWRRVSSSVLCLGFSKCANWWLILSRECATLQAVKCIDSLSNIFLQIIASCAFAERVFQKKKQLKFGFVQATLNKDVSKNK